MLSREMEDWWMHTVDVKAPSPRNLFRENTAQYWTESARKSPNPPNHAKILATLSVTHINKRPSCSEQEKRSRYTHLILNKSLMQILANMIKPPPPIPWITLAAINILILILRAAIKDPAKKMILANSMMGFRPQISLNFPHVGVDAAAARR